MYPDVWNYFFRACDRAIVRFMSSCFDCVIERLFFVFEINGIRACGIGCADEGESDTSCPGHIIAKS